MLILSYSKIILFDQVFWGGEVGERGLLIL